MPPPVPARELGHSIGPSPATVNLAAFLDYVCPYSCKLYKTIRREVLPHYRGKDLRFTFHHQALYERQTDFFDENVWGMARPQIAAALARLAADAAGVPAFEVERALGMQAVEVHGPNPGTRVTQDLKFAVKYARQLGVHVSPTTTLNGLLFDSSSGWGLDKWAGALDPLLEAGALSRLDA